MGHSHSPPAPPDHQSDTAPRGSPYAGCGFEQTTCSALFLDFPEVRAREGATDPQQHSRCRDLALGLEFKSGFCPFLAQAHPIASSARGVASANVGSLSVLPSAAPKLAPPPHPHPQRPQVNGSKEAIIPLGDEPRERGAGLAWAPVGRVTVQFIIRARTDLLE